MVGGQRDEEALFEEEEEEDSKSSWEEDDSTTIVRFQRDHTIIEPGNIPKPTNSQTEFEKSADEEVVRQDNNTKGGLDKATNLEPPFDYQRLHLELFAKRSMPTAKLRRPETLLRSLRLNIGGNPPEKESDLKGGLSSTIRLQSFKPQITLGPERSLVALKMRQKMVDGEPGEERDRLNRKRPWTEVDQNEGGTKTKLKTIRNLELTRDEIPKRQKMAEEELDEELDEESYEEMDAKPDPEFQKNPRILKRPWAKVDQNEEGTETKLNTIRNLEKTRDQMPKRLKRQGSYHWYEQLEKGKVQSEF